MQVTIEPMREADLDDVMRIEHESYPTPWRRETFRREITENRGSCYLVAKAHQPDGVWNVGYAGMWLVADELHITTIAVDPAYRGLKIGERLLLALLRRGTEAGAARATLEVRQSNLVAQRLYRKYHFDAVGMRRGYYTDTAENAIIMWIEDLHDPGLQRFLRERERQLEGRQIAVAGN
ncbi:MAG: ribosomal protein S18-alanine N-acetyltransferase [Armatimonadetes bacterium]|jgi:ribosomal-protein-alanine N-acetyltransferase|nr:ribosomal protein S18-alanine N-acetyltransferase [Armatimonadota bacterium]